MPTKLKNLSLEELSLVDTPANKGAKALLMKRDTSAENGDDKIVDKKETPILDLLKQALGLEVDTIKNQKEANMPNKEFEAEIAKMDDAEKQFFNGLDDEAKKKYMSMDAAARKTFMEEKTKKSDDGAAAGKDGADVNKGDKEASDKNGADVNKAQSTDEIIKNLPKELQDRLAKADKVDDLEKRLTNEENLRKAAEFQKRASAEFPNLKGTEVEKGAMLQAVETQITDETTRKYLKELLKSADSMIANAFNQVGKNAHVSEDSPLGKLEKMAKDIEKDEKIPYHQAYTKAMATKEGSELYAAYEAEKRGN